MLMLVLLLLNKYIILVLIPPLMLFFVKQFKLISVPDSQCRLAYVAKAAIDFILKNNMWHSCFQYEMKPSGFILSTVNYQGVSDTFICLILIFIYR